MPTSIFLHLLQREHWTQLTGTGGTMLGDTFDDDGDDGGGVRAESTFFLDTLFLNCRCSEQKP
jgi:hypothetical protein